MKINDLANKVEQVSSKYADINSIKRNEDWFMLKLAEEVGELNQSYLMLKKQARDKGFSEKQLKENFASEVADVLGQILLIAKNHDIDIEKTMQEKWLTWLDK